MKRGDGEGMVSKRFKTTILNKKNELKLGKTWSATKVWLRPVKAGLGGHDAGLSGVDEGAETTSIPLRKRGRTVLSDCATFNDIRGVECVFVDDKRNDKSIAYQ